MEISRITCEVNHTDEALYHVDEFESIA